MDPQCLFPQHLGGFQWRNTTDLKINHLWLEYYPFDTGITSHALLDNVVMATQYIGPIVTSPQPPVANFTGAPTSGYVPLTVSFTDTSTGTPTSWSWNFGDSTTSTSQNPSHQYTGTGSFTVSLRATNAQGYDDEVKTNYITVNALPSPPVAAFSGTPTSGYAPLAVTFTDASTNTPTSWSWNFGDSTTSTSQNPSHTYSTVGSFTVSLRATNAGGYDDEVKTNYITTTVNPTPQFVAAGTVAAGTGTIAPALPAGIAANDILLLFVESANQACSITNQNGGTWTAVTNSPQYTGTAGGTAATRLTAFWSRYNGTQGAPTVSDSGNHTTGRIVAIRGCATSDDPWDVTAGGVEATADTSGSIPGATTTVANTLVVAAIATALPDATGTANFSSWSNANLTSLTERTDNTSSSGNGGGLAVATGEKAAAGAYGNTAVTCASSTVKAMLSLALKQSGGVAAPVAAFSGTPTSGTAPLSVTFTDASTNTPTSWSWNFGDSTTSTAQNPSHSYAAGTFTVSLRATNAGGYDDEVKTNYITATVAPPVAAFFGTPTSGTAPLNVTFTDSSTNSPTAWSWNFGDSTTSTSQNPSHSYAAGTYTVSLRATNAGGYDDEVKTNYITASAGGSAPVAAFSGTPTSGTAPLSVTFTDQSTNTPTSWSWNFGDSTTSTAQNPSHSYAAGTFTVSLRATNAYGYDDEVKTNYITASAAVPEAEVRGNSVVIADGDSTPSLTDHTDFGSANISGGTVDRTYTIYNTGTASLTVGTVTVSGTHAADFTVTVQPAGSVAPSGNTTFTVRFDPSATGLRSAALSFSTNDADENPYNYSIQGTGTSVTEVYVYPTSYELVYGSLAGGGLADLQSSNDIYMNILCNASEQTAVKYYWSTGYTPSQVSKVTYELELHGSRADTPNYSFLAKIIAGGYTTMRDWGLWPTTDQTFSWESTAVSTYLGTDGTMGMQLCGCYVNANTYNSYLDVVRVKLTLN